MEINGLEPYYNYLILDVVGTEWRLAWCNQTMHFAISHYRRLTGKEITFAGLTSQLANEEVIRSLIFGALVAGDKMKSPSELAAIWDFEEDGVEYIDTMIDGMKHYLPPKSDEFVDDLTEFLDESYPETRQETKPQSVEMDFYHHYSILIKHGFSSDDIGRMTLRGMNEFVNRITGLDRAKTWE